MLVVPGSVLGLVPVNLLLVDAEVLVELLYALGTTFGEGCAGACENQAAEYNS